MTCFSRVRLPAGPEKSWFSILSDSFTGPKVFFHFWLSPCNLKPGNYYRGKIIEIIPAQEKNTDIYF
jgi:hypothetical protein